MDIKKIKLEKSLIPSTILALLFCYSLTVKSQTVNFFSLPSIAKMDEAQPFTPRDKGLLIEYYSKYQKKYDLSHPLKKGFERSIIDCSFGLTEKSENYKQLESQQDIRSDLEKIFALRFKQTEEYSTFPEITASEIPAELKLKTQSAEWPNIKQFILTPFIAQFNQAYNLPMGAGFSLPYQIVVTVPDDSYCPAIEYLIRHRFKIGYAQLPSVDFQCAKSDNYYVFASFFKANYKMAKGYKYSLINSFRCKYKDVELRENPDYTIQKIEVPKTTQIVVDGADKPVNHSSIDPKLMPLETQEEMPKKVFSIHTYYSYDFMQSSALNLEQAGSLDKSLIATTKSEHDKQHNRSYINGEIFESDLQKMDSLLAQSVRQAEAIIENNNETKKSRLTGKKLAKLKESDLWKLQSVTLDKKNPFIRIEIPFEEKVIPEDLERIHPILNNGGYPWFVACLPQTTVLENEDKSERKILNSKLVCLSPNFAFTFLDPRTKKAKYLTLPSICVYKENVESQENCSGTFTLAKTWKLKFPKINLKIAEGKRQEKTRDLVEERKNEKIKLEGGFKVKVIDALSKRPISGANVEFDGKNYSTNAQGEVEVKAVSLKVNSTSAKASHKNYEPNQKIITFRLNEVTNNGIIELEPKKVTVTGILKETKTSKFDHVLIGKNIYIKGFQKTFTGTTKADGSFIIENVPVTLENFYFIDPVRSYDDETYQFQLNVDATNYFELPITPLITTVYGEIRDTLHNLVQNYKFSVSINGQEFSLVTDQYGQYKTAEVPIDGDVVIHLNNNDPRYSVDPLEHPVVVKEAYAPNRRDFILSYILNIYRGTVRDVRNKQGIAGVKIEFFNRENELITTTTTDSNGQFEVRDFKNLSKVKLSHPDYIDENEKLPKHELGTIVTSNFYMIKKEFTMGKIVAVVTWGDNQYDLDSQIFSPTGDHIYYKTLGNSAMSQRVGAHLDTDDTGKSGRETTEFYIEDNMTKVRGKYSFLVYQYGNKDVGFVQNRAKVEVYQNGASAKDHLGNDIGEIIASDNKKYLWDVFTIQDGLIHVENSFPAQAQSMAVELATTNVTNKFNELSEVGKKYKSINEDMLNSKRIFQEDIVRIDAQLASLKSKWDALSAVRTKIDKLEEARRNGALEIPNDANPATTVKVADLIKELKTEESSLVEKFSGPRGESLGKKKNYEAVVKQLTKEKQTNLDNTAKVDEKLTTNKKEEEEQIKKISAEIVELKKIQDEASKKLFQELLKFN